MLILSMIPLIGGVINLLQVPAEKLIPLELKDIREGLINPYIVVCQLFVVSLSI